MKRVVAADLIASFLILLFGYTALSKLFSFGRFRAVMQKVPLIGPGADVVAWIVLLIEAAIVLLLLFPPTRRKGLLASMVLLSIFTAYLLCMLLFAPHLPCNCGGVLNGMGWGWHLGLDLVLVGLAWAGLRFERVAEGQRH